MFPFAHSDSWPMCVSASVAYFFRNFPVFGSRGWPGSNLLRERSRTADSAAGGTGRAEGAGVRRKVLAVTGPNAGTKAHLQRGCRGIIPFACFTENTLPSIALHLGQTFFPPADHSTLTPRS